MAKNNKEYSSPEDVSILSRGIKIEGNIFSEGNIRIDGKVTGNVETSSNLTLGEHSDLNGEIKAKNITISGKVEGTLFTSEKLVLESKSLVIGDISCKILVVESGAKFNGNSRMGDQQTASIQSP
ncbi:MAG: polymer-forming cytoskeletal protein [Bacteroidetes bacterium]|nr:polymer-forming cytoskeletal protein [Bacteroidota bacterium]